jgi:branched-subunit amino acid transport protein
MPLSYKARRRWSLVILLIGLPVYIVVALNVVALFDRPPFWVELLVYVTLGILWALPFRFIFKGIGQVDPDAQKAEGPDPSA